MALFILPSSDSTGASGSPRSGERRPTIAKPAFTHSRLPAASNLSGKLRNGSACPQPSRGFLGPKQRRANAMFRRKRKASDFSAEIEAHIQLETARLQEQGMSEPDARAAARRAFGNLQIGRASCRERV